MANPVILDSTMHRRLKVITARGAAYGENVHFVPVVAEELRSLVLDYPVCLLKDGETGQFGLHALLGFQPGENLYLQGDQWQASYVPLHVRRQPFMVGGVGPKGAGQTPNQATIAIDLDSKRVQEAEGEALFLEDGSNSPYLDGIRTLLVKLMAGIESTKTFIDAFATLDLIESVQLELDFANGERRQYGGVYTVNETKLGELSGNTLEQLHTAGHLQASHLLLASMGHVRKLIDLKNTASTTATTGGI